jgi:hypothetical protein
MQKELGINIKRFQNMAQQKGESSSEEIVRAAFYVLRSFSEVENNFREVFLELQELLRPFLFLADSDLCLKYRLKEGVSLRKALRAVERANAEWLQQRDARIGELEVLAMQREAEGRG